MTYYGIPPGLIFNDAIGWIREDSNMTRAHQGCNATTCPYPDCQSSGSCQGVPFVKSPPLSAISANLGMMTTGLLAPRIVIAFTGLAGAGKTTAAMHLVKHRGFHRVRFAGPLKAMLAALGLGQAEIDGDRKELPCELLGGKTPRQVMQWLGTEWGRNLIAPDLWIRAWQAAVAAQPAGVPVVVDDVRFENEYEALRAIGAMIIRIERPGAGTASTHVSEQFHIPAATTLHNTRDEKNLREQVDVMLRDLSWIDK